MSLATREVREGDYLLRVRRLDDGHVEWALVRLRRPRLRPLGSLAEPGGDAPARGDEAADLTVFISGEASSEQEALRRGRLQLQALGVLPEA